MTKQTIKIDESSLRKKIEEALKLAEGHPGDFTSGWGYPIYVNENGSLHIGGMLNNSSWQPDAIEVVRVNNWNVEDDNDTEYDEDWTREDEVDAAISNYLVDYYVNKVEWNIQVRQDESDMYGDAPSQFEIV